MNKRKGTILQVIWIILMAGGILLCHIVENVPEYYYDSGYYMSLAESFWQDGEFSLYNYPNTYRGMWFPIILAAFLSITSFLNISYIWAWRIFSTIMLVILMYVFPKLFYKENQDNFLINSKRLLLLVLIMVFWKGIIFYPLSDMVAFFFLVVGIYAVIKEIMGGGNLYTFVGGMCFYIAYNIRTIYLFPVLLFVIGTLFTKRPGKKKIMDFAIIILGIMIAGIPQAIVNYNCYQLFSLKVKTEDGMFPNGLFAWQVGVGMSNFQYETYVGDLEIYPVAGLRFIDKVGQAMVQKEGVADNFHILDVFRLLIKYPLDVMGIYTRHAVNMLNPVWGGSYIEDLFVPKMHLTLINYCMLFIWGCYMKMRIVCVRVNEKMRGEQWKLKILTYISLLLPCIMIMPGAIESRFSFPGYMLLYRILLFEMKIEDYKELWRNWKVNPVGYAFLFIIGIAFLSAVWGTSIASLEQELWIPLE